MDRRTDGWTDGWRTDGRTDGNKKSGEGHYEHFWLKIIEIGAILTHFWLLSVSPKAVPGGGPGGAGAVSFKNVEQETSKTKYRNLGKVIRIISDQKSSKSELSSATFGYFPYRRRRFPAGVRGGREPPLETLWLQIY